MQLAVDGAGCDEGQEFCEGGENREEHAGTICRRLMHPRQPSDSVGDVHHCEGQKAGAHQDSEESKDLGVTSHGDEHSEHRRVSFLGLEPHDAVDGAEHERGADQSQAQGEQSSEHCA